MIRIEVEFTQEEDNVRLVFSTLRQDPVSKGEEEFSTMMYDALQTISNTFKQKTHELPTITLPQGVTLYVKEAVRKKTKEDSNGRPDSGRGQSDSS